MAYWFFFFKDTCAPGYENITGVCMQCRAGYAKDIAGPDPCVPCGAGTIPNDDQIQCIGCPSGTFAQNDGQIRCDFCYGEVISNRAACSKLSFPAVFHIYPIFSGN